MLVVGSQALVDWGVKIGRKPRDLDVICTPQEYESYVNWRGIDDINHHIKMKQDWKKAVKLYDGTIVEFELASEELNPTGLWLLEHHYGSTKSHPIWGRSAHPDVVLALKMSHRFLKNNPHFRKTMDDILALRGLNFRIPPEMNDWMKEREKATYDYSHPSLKRDKKSFFSGDGVNYIYEHDDIHEALATLRSSLRMEEGSSQQENRPARPAYIFFQKDPGVDVSVSKEKWLLCSDHVKLMSVLEESYVLALERSQIPNDFSIAPRTSFLIALEKVCTSITSGWWRAYAWDHYYQVLGMYNDDYVNRFQRALEQGKVRPYQGEKHEEMVRSHQNAVAFERGSDVVP